MGYVSDRLQLGGESGRHGPAGRGIRRQGNCSARGAAEEAQGNPHETVMTAVLGGEAANGEKRRRRWV